MSPQDLAAARLQAIANLEQQLQGSVDAAQRKLYERLLTELQSLHENPSLLPVLLEAYRQQILVPLALTYAQQLLHLPGLSLAYFDGLGVVDFAKLRAPLTDYLAAKLGVDAAGAVVPGGLLSTLQGDTTIARAVLTYAYQAQAAGLGLQAYREGLNALVLGGNQQAHGLVQGLYRSSGDDFAQADRALQVISGKELGLSAALYQGGLIDSSRPFCVARNGRVFLDSEIAKFGTSADAYGGYSNKSAGQFNGKPSPYDPYTMCGGYSCRHHWHYVPAVVALRMRADLTQDEKGELYIK
jgi:hypothetical protein